MSHIDIVFDGPPSNEAGRFVEVENSHGVSISFGEWIQREDGYWALRISPRDVVELASDYDPTPWCDGCGAMKPENCHCGPIAEND